MTSGSAFDGMNENMKRALIILTAVVLYFIGIWYAMVILAFADTPEVLKSIFSKSWYGMLAWIIIRHKVAVVIVGGLLSLLLIKYDNKTAQIDSFIVGALSIMYVVIYKWVFLGIKGLRIGEGGIFTWIDITDYLAIGLAIPILVAIINWLAKWLHPPSNQPLEPIR